MAFYFHDNINTCRNKLKKALQFKNLKIKIHKTTQDIWFNKQCLELNLTPKYIHFNTNTNSKTANKATRIGRETWLKEEIKTLYIKKQQLNHELFKKHLEAANSLSTLEWDIFQEHMEHDIHKILSNKQKTLNNKIKKLKSNTSPHPDHFDNTRFQNGVINLTNTQFNKKELDLMNKGFKHNLEKNFNKNDLKQLVVESENAINKLPIDEQETHRHLVANEINNIMKHNKKSINRAQNLIANNIRNKSITNNFIITKADKGNAIVIIDKQEYIKKTGHFLAENNIIKINKDPTQKIQANLKSILKNTELILNRKEKLALINMNPTAPTLKSLPKIHKEDTPIRPIVNSRNSPLYKTSKFLLDFLNKHYTFNINKSITNTKQLIQNLDNTTINGDSQLLSYDVTNMYTNIPIKKSIQIIESNLTNNKKLSNNEIQEFIILLKETLEHNYFQFNKTLYKQPDGLAMGSPLSGKIADIYINHLEEKLFNTNTTAGISHWSRFVDDIFTIIDTKKTNPQNLLSDLNNLDNQTKFTLESENNKQLNFLDLTITRHTSKLEFNIFRKPTTTAAHINNSSNHPTPHKIAAYRSMVKRLINTPLSRENQEKEIKTLKEIAIHNNYNPSIIDDLISKEKQNPPPTTPTDTNTKTDTYTCFTYTNKKIHKITNIFRKSNLKIAFRTTNNLKNKLFNSHTLNTIHKYDKSGVYKLVCSNKDCNCSYVGQTGRRFKDRFKEHKKAIQYNKISSFAEHKYLSKHEFNNIEEELEILHFKNKGNSLNTLENLEIFLDQNSNPVENLNEKSHQNILFQILKNHT